MTVLVQMMDASPTYGRINAHVILVDVPGGFSSCPRNLLTQHEHELKSRRTRGLDLYHSGWGTGPLDVSHQAGGQAGWGQDPSGAFPCLKKKSRGLEKVSARRNGPGRASSTGCGSSSECEGQDRSDTFPFPSPSLHIGCATRMVLLTFCALTRSCTSRIKSCFSRSSRSSFLSIFTKHEKRRKFKGAIYKTEQSRSTFAGTRVAATSA